MKTDQTDAKNIKYLLIFLVAFFSVVVVSLIVKTVRTVQESTFTGNVFNILYVADEFYVIHVNKSENEISYTHISPQGRMPVVERMIPFSTYFGVPLHALIVDTKREPIGDPQSLFTFTNTLEFASQNRYKKKGVNTVDLLKIYLVYRSRVTDNTKIKSFEYENFIPENYGKLDEQLYEIFKDIEIVNRKISVEVVNATEQPGLATSVARVVENWGFDAVQVVGDQSVSKKSSIVIRFDDVQIERDLGTVLGLPVMKDTTTSISDISIILAEDSLKKFVF